MKKARSKSSKSKKNSKSEEEAHIDKPGMDPKPPRDPKSAFLRYRDDVLPEYKKKMPNRTIASITQTIAEKWLKLSDSQKSKYNQEFLDDLNDRYLVELKKFEKKYGPVQHKQFSVDDPPLKGMYYNSVAGAGKITPLEPENKMKKPQRGRGAKYQEELTDDEEEVPPREEDEEETQDEEMEDHRRAEQASTKRGRRGKPEPPKRPQTAFFLYKSENFDKMKKKHPKANAPEVSSLLAEEWSTLSRNDKKKYEDKHDKLMKDYERELEQYESQYGKVERKRKPRSESPTQDKRPRMSQYEMKIKDRLGNRPQIYPSEHMIGNKPRDESRRRKWGPYI